MQTALDRPAAAERLRALRGEVDPGVLDRALAAASASPPPAAWAAFLDRLTLGLGAALIAAGAIYFFAWNWADLSRVAKLGMPLAGVALAAAAAWRAGLDRPAGRAALTVASVFVGVSLATHGQVYQTGADNWENFALWALLILPWTLAGRGQAQLALWLVVAELALGLWWNQERASWGEDRLVLVLAGVTGLAWALREARHAPGAGRWLPRVLFAWGLLLLVGLSVEQVFDDELTAAGSAALLALGAVGWGSLRRGPERDLFLPAAALGAWIFTSSALCARILFDEMDLEAAGALLESFAVIVQAAMAAGWLRRAARRAREVT